MIDENTCPFCKSANNCMAHSDDSCWCNDVKVPAGLTDLVPEEQKRKACICLSCIKLYTADPAAFMENLRNSTTA